MSKLNRMVELIDLNHILSITDSIKRILKSGNTEELSAEEEAEYGSLVLCLISRAKAVEDRIEEHSGE
jgi:hypothetical protein